MYDTSTLCVVACVCACVASYFDPNTVGLDASFEQVNKTSLCMFVCVCAIHRYFDPDTVGLDFKGMVEDLTAAPDGSIVLLHGEPHGSSSSSSSR